MKYKIASILTFLLLLLPNLVIAQAEVTLNDASINPGETLTLTNDTIYLLDGFVFVEEGAVLNIEPGTVIKGLPGTGAEASALIVARGGKIFAEGTSTQPIIFTAEADELNGNLPLDVNGLWGGVIILGNTTLNSEPGETVIEGIPSTETRGIYGCGVTMDCDDDDDSGVFRYVSIRYGGSEIGAGNEINGLTMGGVGRGTTIEYVEVFNNFDDGFEWFGGTVNTRYLVAAFAGDDSFDYDEGFRGKGQFWFAIQGSDADRAGEHDGGTDPEDGQPYATPLIYNVTYIGSGADDPRNNDALIFRDNAGGYYYNSIFTDFGGRGITIEDLESGQDSRQRLDDGELDLANNIWWNFGAGNNAEDFIPQDFVRDALLASGKFNEVADPQLEGISRTNDGGLNPLPNTSGPAFQNVRPIPEDDDFFTEVDYRGAFGLENWASGWTAISELGILAAVSTNTEEQVSQLPTSIELSQNYPNPFNPTTQISFTLPQNENVKLEVFEITGRRIATLVDGVQQAGTNTVSFDASNLSSGMYIYRLQSNSATITRKMTLLK
ncbi:T9SS C-terminal target domain-containing protein [Rhodohalobacter sp. SW132]|uniref:T9SS type A sorting domain-containing protein n=1 Tax=Rhodohalobacter sp. SW132 TaxID=2293433 RepID=UPI000E224891|nr:T9SS type A sorting domain-containing protein [Rhodohalobacter sp. SW132]REL33568.1 T9SS C-terminal target domain-containing protein [Rhodohalobacter sp. SW132]